MVVPTLPRVALKIELVDAASFFVRAGLVVLGSGQVQSLTRSRTKPQLVLNLAHLALLNVRVESAFDPGLNLLMNIDPVLRRR